MSDLVSDNFILQETLAPFSYLYQILNPNAVVMKEVMRALNFWLKIPEEKFAQIEKIMRIIHHSVLLLDDIIDNSAMRRNVKTAHQVYGIGKTICAANYQFFDVIKKLQELNNPNAIKIYTKYMCELQKGQIMEAYFRDNCICPTEEQYRKNVMKKTGFLFFMVTQLMQLFSENKTDFTKLLDVLAYYYQIQNDYLEMTSVEFSKHKTYCEDISEGLFTFPVIHAIKTRPKDDEITNILRQKTKDVKVHKHCVSLLKAYGSLEYTQSVILKLKEEVVEEAKKLGENRLLIEFLETDKLQYM